MDYIHDTHSFKHIQNYLQQLDYYMTKGSFRSAFGPRMNDSSNVLKTRGVGRVQGSF